MCVLVQRFALLLLLFFTLDSNINSAPNFIVISKNMSHLQDRTSHIQQIEVIPFGPGSLGNYFQLLQHVS